MKWQPALIFLHNDGTTSVLEPKDFKKWSPILKLEEDSDDDGSREGLYHSVLGLTPNEPPVVLAISAYLYTDNMGEQYEKHS